MSTADADKSSNSKMADDVNRQETAVSVIIVVCYSSKHSACVDVDVEELRAQASASVPTSQITRLTKY